MGIVSGGERKASTALSAGVASLAKSVLEYHGGFLYVRLHRGDVVALFLEEGESRHATALTRSSKSF